ncbi:MAG: ABC transporter substrate-binding protein, partial [Candidatus Hodarchaeota archaeon]
DTPELGNDKVRLALNYAIDKAQLINQFSPTELVEETTNLLPSGIETRESLNGFPYDRDYAKSLLNESGYPIGSDGYRANLTLVANISLSPITSRIQTDLEAVGINLTIITNNVPSLVQSGNFDIYIEDFIHIQDPDLISPFVTSTGNLNFGSWSFQLDDWVDLGRITPARQERDYYYKQAQLQIQEKAPLLFLLDRIDYFASLESFKDYVWLDSSGYRIGFDYTISNNNPGIKSKILKRSNVQGCTPSCTVDNWYIGPEGTNCASDQTKLYNSDTDVEIESTQVCLTFVIKKTYELTNLGSTLPQQSGIFYKVSVDIDSENYKIKCSYSGNEINEKLDGLDLCKLALFKRKSGNWKEINTYDHSTRDRFVTVEVKGDKILSLQECYEECHCSTNLPLFSFSSVFVLILVRKRVNKN